MKSLNSFSKIFLILILSTVAFLSLTAYAAKQAYSADPDFLKKVEEKYHWKIHLNNNGFLAEESSGPKELTHDSWNFTPPKNNLSIKILSGDIALKTTTAKEIKISAEGLLNSKVAPRLLKTEITEFQLAISQPENGTENLRVQIEIPTSFTKNLSVITASGDITAESLSLNSVELKTVSGAITLNKVTIKDLALKTVSGNFQARESSIADLSGKSVSGDIEVYDLIPANVDFASVSGNIKLKIIPNEKTNFSLNSVSGDIFNKHEHQLSNNYDLQVKASTMSGNIQIE